MSTDREAYARWKGTPYAGPPPGGIGSCWVCGSLTANQISGGRRRCLTCDGEGYVTKEDGTPFRAPDIPWDVPGWAPPPEKVTPIGVLPDWWADIPLSREAMRVRVDAVADGRRPEIDRLTFGPPDGVRKLAAKAREASWEVWTAVMVDAGTKGRPKALLVAYRPPEMVVASWEQDANLTWKPKGGTHWVGRRPARYGEQSWTALMGVIKGAAAREPNSDLPAVTASVIS